MFTCDAAVPKINQSGDTFQAVINSVKEMDHQVIGRHAAMQSINLLRCCKNTALTIFNT